MIGFLKKQFKIIIVLLVLTVAGFFIYNNVIVKNKNNKKTSTKVKKGTLKEELVISGTVDAEEKATLRFKTSGRLAWVGVKEGDYVKKYQAIASLDQRELKMNLKKELLDYMNERWDFEQTKDDYKDELWTDVVKRIKEKSQFDLENTVLDVEIDNLAVEYANLWTPIEGIVTYVEAPHAGVNITATQAEFEVINPSSVYFSALADETEVIKLREGLPGMLVLDAFELEEFSGSIKNISFTPKSGETGTVYEVKFMFAQDNSNYKYRMGMAGDLSFITRSKENVLFIPLKYVKKDNGKSYVEVKREGKYEKAYVQTGMETDDEIEITGGVAEGTAVYK